jgi:hypothetical protein
VQCSAVQCSAVQCSAVQCSAVQCSAVQCSAVQCSAVQPSLSLYVYHWYGVITRRLRVRTSTYVWSGRPVPHYHTDHYTSVDPCTRYVSEAGRAAGLRKCGSRAVAGAGEVTSAAPRLSSARGTPQGRSGGGAPSIGTLSVSLSPGRSDHGWWSVCSPPAVGDRHTGETPAATSSPCNQESCPR